MTLSSNLVLLAKNFFVTQNTAPDTMQPWPIELLNNSNLPLRLFMKSSTRSPFNTAQALKICGVLLILMTIVNIIFVLTLPNLPPKPTSLDTLRSQVEIVVQLVDQGFVSLLGLIVLAIGLWMDSVIETTRSQRKFWRAIGIVAFLLASLMGLMYLIITPLHLSNAQLARKQTLERIEQEVALAETQLNNRINTELQQQQGRIGLLMQASDEQLKQAIASGQVSNEQATLIEQFKKDPKTLEQFLKKEDERIRGQAQVEISTRKATAEKQAQLEDLKTGLRVGISSVILAIAYAALGWTGLRTLASKNYLGARDYGLAEQTPTE